MRCRKVTGIVASVALGTATVGCGSDETEGSGDPQITYWATNMAPTIADDEAALRPQLDAFAEETGIEVDLEVVPWDSLWNRILTAVSSGEGPDVLNIGNTWTASLQATGAFVEFDNEALTAIGGLDKFVETSLASTGPERQVPIAVPLYSQSYGLYYNMAIFDAAGIAEPPATWNDFVDTAEQLTVDTDNDGEIDQWGVALLAGAAPVNSHFAFILGRQNGGSLFDDSGEPQFDSDQQVAAVKQYIDLMETQHVVAPGNAEYTRTEASSQFAQGNAAMIIAQSGTRGFLAELGFEDYAVAPMPVLSPLPPGGRDVRTMVAGINISVFETSKNQQAALELVRFLTSLDAQVALNGVYGTLPVLDEAYDHDSFGDDSIQTFGNILRDHAEAFPQVPEVGQMETLVGGAMKELFAQAAIGSVTEADIRAALEEANSQMAATG